MHGRVKLICNGMQRSTKLIISPHKSCSKQAHNYNDAMLEIITQNKELKFKREGL